jgi:hypothetical protein
MSHVLHKIVVKKTSIITRERKMKELGNQCGKYIELQILLPSLVDQFLV